MDSIQEQEPTPVLQNGMDDDSVETPPIPVKFKNSRRFEISVFGMDAKQVFILLLMLFVVILMLGGGLLLMTGRIAP